jgi:predicted RNA-binding Zn-ribbon protein involved in translation (DUF1610 family)
VVTLPSSSVWEVESVSDCSPLAYHQPMTNSAPLRRLSRAQADALENNFQTNGPLYTNKPELIGDTDFLCPGCGTVLVEKTHAEGVKRLLKIECYKCGVVSSGEGLSAETRPVDPLPPETGT